MTDQTYHLPPICPKCHALHRGECPSDRSCPDPVGSLFWQTRGTRKHLMVTTERGSKDTGLYIWKFGKECGISWTAHAQGGRSLGRFLGEVSAQVEAEKFYLSNTEHTDASR